MSMNARTFTWLKALTAAFVGGVANAGLAALGITGAQTVGVNVPQLDPKQFLSICVSGGIVGAFLYLKQSPVPPDSTGETAIINRITGSNTTTGTTPTITGINPNPPTSTN